MMWLEGKKNDCIIQLTMFLSIFIYAKIKLVKSNHQETRLNYHKNKS